MKLARFFSLLLFFIFASQKLAGAENVKMFFWYPGEAGSTAIAQPVIDSFFQYVSEKMAPDKISGKYFNTLPDGMKSIHSERPNLIIVSLPAYEMRSKMFATAMPFLKTLPLPEGKDTELYYVLGGTPKMPAGKIKLFSREPVTPEFAHKYIIPNADDIETASADNLMPLLKDASAGKLQAGIVLKAYEYNALKGLSADWAKKLSLWATSKPIPSAPFVIMGAPPKNVAKLKEVLLKMSSDPAAKELLETLRLKGFAE